MAQPLPEMLFSSAPISYCCVTSHLNTLWLKVIIAYFHCGPAGGWLMRAESWAQAAHQSGLDSSLWVGLRSAVFVLGPRPGGRSCVGDSPLMVLAEAREGTCFTPSSISLATASLHDRPQVQEPVRRFPQHEAKAGHMAKPSITRAWAKGEARGECFLTVI